MACDVFWALKTCRTDQFINFGSDITLVIILFNGHSLSGFSSHILYFMVFFCIFRAYMNGFHITDSTIINLGIITRT